MSMEPTPAGSAPQAPQATSTGLDPKLAALLAYMFGWVSGLVFILIEKQHAEVRFHAAQSLVVSGALTAVYIVLNVLSVAGGFGTFALVSLLSLLVGIASLVLWIMLMVKGYALEHWKLPVAGDMAENIAAGKSPTAA